MLFQVIIHDFNQSIKLIIVFVEDSIQSEMDFGIQTHSQLEIEKEKERSWNRNLFDGIQILRNEKVISFLRAEKEKKALKGLNLFSNLIFKFNNAMDFSKKRIFIFTSKELT